MKRQEGLRSLACSPTRESWHSGEQSGWGRVETGEATQHVRAEPGLEPKVTWLKAQPFALYPTPLNVGLGGGKTHRSRRTHARFVCLKPGLRCGQCGAVT